MINTITEEMVHALPPLLQHYIVGQLELTMLWELERHRSTLMLLEALLEMRTAMAEMRALQRRSGKAGAELGGEGTGG